MNCVKSSLFLSIGVALTIIATELAVGASTPEAWEGHYQMVNAECLNVSNLGNSAPAGDIITYSDDVGFDALLVRGTDPVNLQSRKVLCLFNRQTRRAFVSDAEYLQQNSTPNLVGVPGQSIEQVRQWVERHAFLPPLQPVEALEQGYPDYQSVLRLGQQQGQSASYLSFDVFTGADGIVTHQTLDHRDPSSILPQLAFTQTDAEGLQLIQTIYGEAIKDDFVQASLLSRPDSCDFWDSAVNRYAGNLFTYQTWNEGSSAQFTILLPGSVGNGCESN